MFDQVFRDDIRIEIGEKVFVGTWTITNNFSLTNDEKYELNSSSKWN